MQKFLIGFASQERDRGEEQSKENIDFRHTVDVSRAQRKRKTGIPNRRLSFAPYARFSSGAAWAAFLRASFSDAQRQCPVSAVDHKKAYRSPRITRQCALVSAQLKQKKVTDLLFFLAKVRLPSPLGVLIYHVIRSRRFWVFLVFSLADFWGL